MRQRAAARLARLPQRLTALVIVALLVAGLLVAGPAGGVLLALGLLALASILALTWPHLTRPERGLRLAVLVLVVGLAVVRLVPR